MIGNITMGQYIPGESPLHRMDPRTKMIWTGILMVVAFLINTWQEYVMLGAFTLALILVSGVPLKQSLKGIKPLLFILGITAVLNMLFVGGTPLFELGFIKVTYEGVILALKLFFRLVIFIVIGSLMTLTTTPMSLTDGLERMLKPLERIGLPAHEIAMMMSIALRFIPTLMEETERIMKAQASRGADFDTGSLLSRVKSFIPVLIPLFVSAFKRAEELAEAMEARCYRGGKGRTRLKQIRFTALDGKVSLAGLVFLCFMFGPRLLGWF